MTIKFIMAGAVVSIFLLSPAISTAYDESTTHPALTQEIVDFYNASFPTAPLTSQQKEWVIAGSRDEDTPPRWINHFYDPVRGVGWSGDKSGSIPAPVVSMLGQVGLSSEPPLSAVAWIHATLIQNQYERYGGNFTWERGIQAAGEGDAERAYKTLGHALHLLEDMSVPDHTRDDTHAHVLGDDGSPYEQYSTRYTRSTLHLADSLVRIGEHPDTTFATPEEALKKVAEYSNHYFFSKDTINDVKYLFPKIIREDDNFGYGVDENGAEFPLVKIKYIKNGADLKKNYILIKDEENTPILEAYFSRLSRKAVITGAGMVRLFQKQKEDAIVNKDYPVHIAYYDSEKLVLIPSVSLFGEYQIAKTYVGQVVDAAVSATTKTGSTLFSWIASFNPFAPKVVVVAPADMVGVFVPQPAPVPARISVAPSVAPPRIPVVSAPPKIGAVLPVRTATNQPVFFESVRLPTLPSVLGDSIGVAPAISAPIFAGIPSTGSVVFLGIDPSVFGASTQPTVVSQDVSSTPPSSDPVVTAPVWKFTAKYDKKAVVITLSWDRIVPPVTASGTVPTVLYELFENTGTASTSIGVTASSSFSFPITVIGKSYSFSVVARDENDEMLNTATVTVVVPAIFANAWLYRDTRTGASANRTIFEIDYTDKNSLPNPLGVTSHYGLIAYHNKPAVTNNPIEVTFTKLLLKNTADIISLIPPTCKNPKNTSAKQIVTFSFASIADCNNPANSIGAEATPLESEDNRFFFIANLSAPTSDDYIALAFYQEQWKNGSYLTQVLTDATQYHFADTPPAHHAPTVPSDFALAFDPVHLQLKAQWSASRDSDSPDANISYQIRIIPDGGSESDALWQDYGKDIHVSIPVDITKTGYTVAVRAVDEFGNTSDATSASWTLPSGFVPYIKSGSNNNVSQEFVLQSESDVRALSVWTDNFTTDSRNHASNVCGMELVDVEMQTTSTPATVIATADTPNSGFGESDAYQYRGDSCAGDLRFTFASTPHLLANHRYTWRFHLMLPFNNFPAHGAVQFFGTASNTAGGIFSDRALVNAKFTLENASGESVFSN